MAEDSFGKGPRNEEFASGRSPQALNQLQATGAEVFGSDGEKVGDLAEVRDADFSVDRGTLRRTLNIPVTHVERLTGEDNIVLAVSSDQVNEMGWEGSLLPGGGDPYASYSESPKVEKGVWGTKREET